MAVPQRARIRGICGLVCVVKAVAELPHSKRGGHRLKPVLHGGGQEIGVTVLEGGIGRLGGGAIRIGVALESDEARLVNEE